MLAFRRSTLMTGQDLQALARRFGWRSRRPVTIAKRLVADGHRAWVRAFLADDTLVAVSRNPSNASGYSATTYKPDEWRLVREES